jgi:hypothetical protein
MTRLYATPLVLLATLLNVPITEAGPIVYFDTYRSLSANGQLLESTDTGQWWRSLPVNNGSAEHRSEILQSGIRATVNLAALSNTSGSAGADLSSQLFTSFEIDVPYSASLDLGLSAIGDPAYLEGYFYDQNTQTMLAEVVVDSGIGRLLYEGVLEPGLYSFYLLSQVNAPAGPYFGHGTINGDLALEPFAPVPEPATLTLFGMGLAATAWRRRRQ